MKIFRNVQAGGDPGNEGSDVGGSDDTLIYLEFLEAIAAAACFKIINHIPLDTRIEQFLRDQVNDGASKILKKMKRHL